MDKHKSPEAERQKEEARQHEMASLAQVFSSSTGTERERLIRIMDMLPCYVTLVNCNHQLLFYNKTFERYFGKPDGNPCYKVLRGQQACCEDCPPFEVLPKSKSTVMEWVHPESRHAFRVYSYPFEDTDGARCVLKAGFNITATMRVQQALDLSEQSYRAITDTLSIGIALLDTDLHIKAGNIRLSQWFTEKFRLNRRICDVLQCGSYTRKALSDTQYTCPDCPFIASLKDGAGHEKEVTVMFGNGQERIARLVTCPVKPGKHPARQKNEVRALIMMLEDITNRLRVNQQLQRARKLESMNTLAASIAHEINQPLSALRLYVSGLEMLMEKQRNLEQETIRERLSLVMREADKIRSIIIQMRTLVMREKGLPAGAVSLEASIHSVLCIMNAQFKAHSVTVITDIEPSLPLVRCNDLQMEQVLINLLANAMYALRSSSDAEQGEQQERRQKIIRIRAARAENGARVLLEVVDSGSGLPKGSERIFEPFYTTKKQQKCMGLGLAIVHGLVSAWGGEISALPRHPELGGAAFSVFLPLAVKDAPLSEVKAKKKLEEIRPPETDGSAPLPKKGKRS